MRHTGGGLIRTSLRIYYVDPTNGATYATECSPGHVNDVFAVGVCRLPVTGDYFAFVYDWQSTNLGNYDFMVERIDEIATEPTAYGEIEAASLTSLEWKGYTFEGTQGDVVLVRIGTGTIGTQYPGFRLYGPSGELVEDSNGPCRGDWQAGGGVGERICELDASGTFRLFVLERRGVPNTSQLNLERISDGVSVAPASWTWLPANSPLVSSIAGYESDAYLFVASSGETVTVSMERAGTSSVRSRFVVYDGAGSVVCSKESTNFGEAISQNCPITSSGVHVVFASERRAQFQGGYQLTLGQAPSPPVPGDVTDPTADKEAARVAHRIDPVNTASGTYTYSHTDIAIPGRGVPLAFTRNYHSGSEIEETIGTGWSHNWEMRVEEDAVAATVFYPGGFGRVFYRVGDEYLARQGTFDELVKNVDGSHTLTARFQMVYQFDSAGRLVSVIDRNGNTTTLAYDGSGYLDTVTDPGGRSLDFTVDGQGRITVIEDPLARTVEFTYDGSGDLVQVTNLLGGETDYTYGGDGMLTLTDSNANVQLTNIYDSAGRVAEQEDALGGVMCIYYGSAPSYSSAGCPGASSPPAANEVVTVDQRGEETRDEYDELYRVVRTTDAEGGVTEFEYDGWNNPLIVSDPIGRETVSTFDDDGNVLTRTNHAGETWTYTYNAFNDVLTSTDPLGRTTEFEYDVDGNLVQVTDADLNETDFVVDANGLVTSVTDALVHITTYDYDTYGNRIEVTNPELETWLYDYDLGGRLLEVTDPLTHATTYTYNDADQPLTVTNHLSEVTTYTYDLKGNRLSVEDANLNETTFVYDDMDRLVETIDPLLQSTEYVYDGVGNRTEVINTRAESTEYTYDGVGRRLTVTDPLARTMEYEYDAAGQLISRTDARSIETAYHYDNAGRLRRFEVPDDPGDFPTAVLGETPWLYWRLGESSGTTAADASGNGRTGTIGATVTLGAAGSTIIDADTSMTFNTMSTSQVSIGSAPSAAQARSFAIWFRTTEASPNADGIWGHGTTSSTRRNFSLRRDASGNNVLRWVSGSDDQLFTLPAGANVADGEWHYVVVTYDGSTTARLYYDGVPSPDVKTLAGALNTLNSTAYIGRTLSTSERWRGQLDEFAVWTRALSADEIADLYEANLPAEHVRYGYDRTGNRTLMDDPTGTTTYAHDDLNRLASVTTPDAATVGYQYDAVGNRTQLTYPDTKTVTYGYDDANRLVSVTDWLTNQTTYDYDAAGRLIDTTYPNGVSADYAYDDVDRLLSLTNANGGGTFSSFTYLLDDVGNRTQVTDNSGVSTFVYDDLYRLTSVTYPGPVSDTYTYDALGNRLTKNADDYTYDVADQLTDVEGTALDYDANGNQLEHGADTFAYDHENRLVEATVDSVLSSYVYNGDGLRVSQTADSVTTDYTWDIASGLPVVLQDGALSYVYGLDLISATDGAGDQVYFSYDGLGSTTDLTDDTGGVMATYQYDVFGAVRASTGSPTNVFRFTGEQLDPESGLYFLRARYYDPVIGRFISRDLLEFDQRYAYAGNNPVLYVDPNGMCPPGFCPDFLGGLVEAAKDAFQDLVNDPKNQVTAAQAVPALACRQFPNPYTCTAAGLAYGAGYLYKTVLNDRAQKAGEMTDCEERWTNVFDALSPGSTGAKIGKAVANSLAGPVLCSANEMSLTSGAAPPNLAGSTTQTSPSTGQRQSARE